MQQKPETPSQPMIDISSIVNSVNRRVRVLEERNNNIQRKTGVIEDNMINKNKVIFENIKKINSDITQLKKEFEKVKDSIKLLVRELQFMAKKENVDVIQKYLDLWNPTNFVTNRELDKAVKRIISEK